MYIDAIHTPYDRHFNEKMNNDDKLRVSLPSEDLRQTKLLQKPTAFVRRFT